MTVLAQNRQIKSVIKLGAKVYIFCFCKKNKVSAIPFNQKHANYANVL